MRTKIIALPTDVQTNLALDGKIWVYSEYGFGGDRLVEHHHLYMLAPDAEIKLGDYVYFLEEGESESCIEQITCEPPALSNCKKFGAIKIIASTDPSIHLDLIGKGVCREFCESENK